MQGKRCRKATKISIHAPPRGATRRRRQWKPLRQFQFTPLREGRPMTQATLYIGLNISIHAPPRGATTAAEDSRDATNFNSRPSARGDPAVSRVVFLPFVFQFTPLREGRRRSSIGTNCNDKFQFTPLREGRRHATRSTTICRIFQFTPLREGRHGFSLFIRVGVISIHAPPRGAT